MDRRFKIIACIERNAAGRVSAEATAAAEATPTAAAASAPTAAVAPLPTATPARGTDSATATEPAPAAGGGKQDCTGPDQCTKCYTQTGGTTVGAPTPVSLAAYVLVYTWA